MDDITVTSTARIDDLEHSLAVKFPKEYLNTNDGLKKVERLLFVLNRSINNIIQESKEN